MNVTVFLCLMGAWFSYRIIRWSIREYHHKYHYWDGERYYNKDE